MYLTILAEQNGCVAGSGWVDCTWVNLCSISCFIGECCFSDKNIAHCINIRFFNF